MGSEGWLSSSLSSDIQFKLMLSLANDHRQILQVGLFLILNLHTANTYEQDELELGVVAHEVRAHI